MRNMNSLSRLLLVTVLGVVFATGAEAGIYSGGAGTAESPFLISTPQDLVSLANPVNSADWNNHFLMTHSIDMSGVVDFTPIAPDTNLNTTEHDGTNFTGVFDGGGYAIQNLVIDLPDQNFVGLFGVVYTGGVVQDLNLENVSVTGLNLVGALIGSNYGTVSDCHMTGSVTGGSYVGGLVGVNQVVPVTECYAAGTVTAAEYVGGLVGWNDGDVSGCYASGAVSDGNWIGGLIGVNYGDATVSECYAINSVSGAESVGGLVGWNEGAVSECFASGEVEGTLLTGGLVGENYEGGSIAQCYATGAVTGDDYVGGLAGENYFGSVSTCYAKGALTGNEHVGGLLGYNLGPVARSFWDLETSQQSDSGAGKGLSTVQMRTVNIFRNAGWGDGGVWEMSNGQYPHLTWEETPASAIPAAEAVPLAGAGTIDDPYQVGTAEEFALLSWHVSVLDKHILLTADVDCADVTIYPIGDLGAFTGVFDGDGRVIRNVAIDEPLTSYVGVFSWLATGAEIRDLGIVDGEISGRVCVGALAGVNEGIVERCSASTPVTGRHIAGGLVGENLNSGMVTKCYASGATEAEDNAGGLVGRNYEGTISRSYATGAAAGESNVGGLVGGHYLGTVSECYSTGTATGTEDVGGLIGYSSEATTEISFWDTETSGLASSAGGTGKTSLEMITQDTFVNALWDFENVWYMLGGASYPYLIDNPQFVLVPNVEGMTQAAAETAITSAHLNVGTITEQFSAFVPLGQVISQSPWADTTVAPNTAINLIISSGPAPVSVPNVVGMTQAAAETAINDANLTVGTVTEQFSDTVATGKVISQNPSAGATAAPGTAVNLIVSKGKSGGGGISCNGGITTATPPKNGGDTLILSVLALAFLAASRFWTQNLAN